MNLIELQNKIHAQNKAMGWWDEPRPFSTFVCLFHSELSEAMEGDRKQLMDEHLPQYPMFWVELADFVIRCMDWLGSVKFDGEYNTNPVIATSNTRVIARLHLSVSEAFLDDVNGFNDYQQRNIKDAVDYAIGYAKGLGVDLHQIILEKVEYNKHRADHKRENRAKEGGKKY